SENRIPGNDKNTAVVISSDYDLDGDIDLFVGNLSDPLDFGLPVQSTLLQNDGNGKFTTDETFKLDAKVTDAIWEDLDGDGRQDLLIATEWDKPRVFMNLKRGLTEIEVASNTKGLWQAIGFFDADGDQDKDIILGNWGLNTKFSLNELPLKMYHNDFNGDGKNEVLVAYAVAGAYYPISSRDELSSQMKNISKKYVNYSDFALKTIEDIVGKELLENSLKYEVEELASGYLQNNGGKFNKFIPFTSQLQMAPISFFSELKVSGEDLLLVSGNALSVNTYHGGYTSLKGGLLKTDGTFEAISNFGVDSFSGQVKATASINMRDTSLLLVLENNGTAKTYRYEKEK
ncbi:VCBS repeat-containing protein, partial [Maribacter sp.]|nr:VCBS repeat-containing protein [Maribacter sp.]